VAGPIAVAVLALILNAAFNRDRIGGCLVCISPPRFENRSIENGQSSPHWSKGSALKIATFP